MGSGESIPQQNQDGSINISLEKNVYQPSEEIKGKVELNVVNKFAITDLFVGFQGKESILRNYTEYSSSVNVINNTTTKSKEEKEKLTTSPLYDIQRVVNNYKSDEDKNIIEPGYYSAPINLSIPRDAPSSTKFIATNMGEKFATSIDYSVYGHLKTPIGLGIKHTLPITVIE